MERSDTVKAILVLDDMPENCFKCKLQDWANCRIVKGCHTGYTRPDWCPLKELPDKITFWKGKSTNYQQGHRDGYNTCIDEILGDKE